MVKSLLEVIIGFIVVNLVAALFCWFFVVEIYVCVAIFLGANVSSIGVLIARHTK